MIIYQPYCYLIGWSKLNKFYYGTEYGIKSKTANPSNLWNEYFTSCKIVQEYRITYGEPDIIQIRKTFNTAKEACLWEEKVLRRLKVNKDGKWINSNIAGAIFMTPDQYKEIGKKTSKTKKEKFKSGETQVWNKGTKGLYVASEETKLKMSKAGKGKKKPEGFGLKISLAQSGVTKSEEHKRKLSEANKGKFPERILCSHCSRNTSVHFIKKHEFNCKLNPINIQPLIIFRD